MAEIRRPLFDPMEVLKEAWGHFTRQIGTWIAIGAVFGLLQIFLIATCIGGLLFTGPLLAGLHVAAYKQLRGEVPAIGDLFSGMKWFSATMLASLVSSIAIIIGFCLCIIPGFVLYFWWMFAIPLCVSHNLGAFEALARSKEMVRRSFMEFVVFGLLMFAVHIIAGFVPLGGLIIGMPLQVIATAILVRDLFGLEGALPPLRPAPPAPVAVVACPRCGAGHAPGTRFCTGCGAAMH